MFQGDYKASKIDIAVARYKQGRCPCCGKSLGESRGLEYRARSRDLYCHACRRRWPIEVDLTALRDELSFLESAQADIHTLPDPDLPKLHGDSGQRQNGLRRLGRLFQRIVLG